MPVYTRAAAKAIYPGRSIGRTVLVPDTGVPGAAFPDDWDAVWDSAILDEDISAFGRTLIDDANAGAALTTLGLSANGQSLVTAADYAAMRALLDLESGIDFLSPAAIAAAYQPLDADLTAIAALASAADKLPYATGAQAWALTDLSAFARTILDDANAAAVRATIGAGTGSGDFLASGAVPMTGDITLKNGTVFTDYANGKAVVSGTTPMFALGGTSSLFPAWKRNGAALEARLADDSAGARVYVGDGTEAAPGLAFGSATGAGMWYSSGFLVFSVGGAKRFISDTVAFSFYDSGAANVGSEYNGSLKAWSIQSGGLYGWSSSLTNGGAGLLDTAFARVAAGVAEVNLGSAGGLGLLAWGSRVLAKTSNHSVAAAEKAAVFTNEGAGGEVNFTLPTAVAGYRYTFIVQATQNLRITAATGDTIRVAGTVSAAAGNMVNAVIGSSVTLVAINATEWIAESAINGVWTVT